MRAAILSSLCVLVACSNSAGPSGFSASGGDTTGGSGSSGGSSSGASPTSGALTSGGSATSAGSTGELTGASTGAGGSTSTTSTTGDPGTTGEAGSSGGVEGTSTGGSSGEGSSSTGGPLCVDAPLPGSAAVPKLVSCPNVKKQSIWCVFLTDVAVMAVGLEDGVACQEKTLQQSLGFTTTASLAAIDESTLLVCDDKGGLNGVLTRVSIETGAVEALPGSCQAITHAREHLLVYDKFGGSVQEFEDLDAVLAGTPIATVIDDPPMTRNIASDGAALFTAWHSDDHVGRRTLPCGSDLGDLELQDYSDWIGGLSVTDVDVLVVLKVLGQEELHTFNATSGAAISSVPLSFDGFVQPRGLACYTGMP